MAIYHRDGFRCIYCRDDQQLTLDHVLPDTQGGTNHPSNLVTCCHWCNSIRQDSSMRHWLEHLEAQGHARRNVRRRIARATARPLNREEGRRLARERRTTATEKADAATAHAGAGTPAAPARSTERKGCMSIKVIELTEEEIHRYRCGAKKSQLLDRIRERTGCSAVEAVQALRFIEKEGLPASLAALPGGGVK